MPAGRPREHDREQIFEDLIEWSLLPDSLNLNGFCGLNKLSPSKLTEFVRSDNRFRLAYEEAKSNLAMRREKYLMEGLLHVKAYESNKHVYDYFMRDEDRDLMKYQSELKKQENIISNEAMEKAKSIIEENKPQMNCDE